MFIYMSVNAHHAYQQQFSLYLHVYLFTEILLSAKYVEVHLEVAHSLEADLFFMVLRLLQARSRNLVHIYSDNGSGPKDSCGRGLRRWIKNKLLTN